MMRNVHSRGTTAVLEGYTRRYVLPGAAFLGLFFALIALSPSMSLLGGFGLLTRNTSQNLLVPLVTGGVLVYFVGYVSSELSRLLAAWLVRHRGLSVDEALAAFVSTGRNPREAVHCRNATEKQLRRLLRGS